MFQDKLTKSIAEAAAQIKTEPPKNEVNTKSVEGAVVSIMTNEELKGNQHKIDANKNGKVDAHDFKLLRSKKKMNEDDTGYQDRYAVKSGKAVKHNPMRGEKDEPHHVWADSPEHAVRKHATKTKSVQEGIKGAGVGGALGAIAGGPVGAAIGGALGHVAGEVLSSAKNKAKAMGRIAMGPSMADSKMKKEEIQQIDEIGDTAKGQYLLSKTRERAKDREYSATSAGKPSQVRKQRSVASGAGARMTDNTRIYGASAGAPSLKSRIGSTVKKATSAIKKVFTREDVESIFNDFTLDEIHMFMMSEEFEMLHVESQEQIDSYLEERTLNEGFPTVADAKKRMAAGQSSFEKKKVSTGTVYSRKYKDEPEQETPQVKKKKMSEMLDLYKNNGVDSLMENLMIEEPSQDEYKKETEIAQAKAEGKIRNDKGIAKAATQGVKMEEVEQIDELVGKSKLPSIAAYHKQKSAEAKGKMETVRSSNTKLPVPKATSAKIYAKDAEAKYHSTQAKRADALMKKEEVELEMYDADEINGVQIDNIEERSMTEPEMKKREEIVKSMKKGIQGFKDRYGARAKDVMYATATKQSMKD